MSSRNVCHACVSMSRDFLCGVCDVPLEDARAVVDEPVAVLKRGPLLPLTARFLAPALDLPFGDHPLYRHPQRPMVLPDRICGKDAWRSGWNASLDRIAELNK